MEFGLSKCAKATFKRGKLQKSDYVQLDEETMIKDLEQEKVYKYLGIDNSSGIQHATIKQKLKKKLITRTWLIRKTELNSKNRVTAINMLAIPVITYGFSIINWSLSEVKILDIIKGRKTMTTHSMHHPKGGIHVFTSQEVTRGWVWLNLNCLIKHRRSVFFDTWIYQMTGWYD